MGKLYLYVIAALVVFAAGTCLATQPAYAAICTWSGATDSFWSTNGNWAGCTVPVAGDDLVFDNMGTNTTMVNDLTSGLNFNTITVSGTGYSFAGNAFVIDGGMAITQSVTISNNITISASQVFDVANPATLTLSGALHVDAQLVFSNNGITTITGTGGIHGASPFGVGDSATRLNLYSTNNDYTGLLVTDGFLYVNSSSSMGNATALFIGPNGQLELQGNNINISIPINQGGQIHSLGTGNVLSGIMNLEGNTNIQATSGNDLTITGVISSSSGTYVDFVGDVTLTADNTYTLLTTLSTDSTSLYVNGSQPSTNVDIFNSLATLGGNGTVGAVLCSGGGHITPGPAINTIGQLTIQGNLDISCVEPFSIDINLNGTIAGTSYDQLNVIGTISLSQGLNVTLGYTATVGDSFTILNNDAGDAVTGTFTDLSEGATFIISGVTFEITYIGGDGNDVVLSVLEVPPPVISSAASSTTTATTSLPPLLPDTGIAGAYDEAVFKFAVLFITLIGMVSVEIMARRIERLGRGVA